MRLEPFALAGRVVRLEPLRRDHARALVAAGVQDRSSYGYTPVPPDVPSMLEYIGGLLRDRDAGTAMPFAQVRLADDAVVGCTRFLEIRTWGARATPSEVEIGGTWLAADAQRTALNTEAKLLLLGQAFEGWDVQRVQICTDARNERSRAAIERLGATFEGVLRSHRMEHGELARPARPRDTAVYSILPDEWPAVRRALTARLDAR